MPGRIRYFIAGFLALGGVVAFAILIFVGIGRAGRSLDAFSVPGAKVFELTEGKNYTVYYEFQSFYEGQAYSGPENLTGLSLSVTSNTSDQVIPTRAASVNANYAFGSRKGRSMFQFKRPVTGPYTLRGSYPDDPNGPKVILSLSHGFGTTLTFYILTSIGTFMVTSLMALGLLLHTYFRRRQVLKVS